MACECHGCIQSALGKSRNRSNILEPFWGDYLDIFGYIWSIFIYIYIFANNILYIYIYAYLQRIGSKTKYGA